NGRGELPPGVEPHPRIDEGDRPAQIGSGGISGGYVGEPGHHAPRFLADRGGAAQPEPAGDVVDLVGGDRHRHDGLRRWGSHRGIVTIAVGEIRPTAGRRSAMAVTDLDLGKYKLGWSDAEAYSFKPKRGLDEDLLREITWM